MLDIGYISRNQRVPVKTATIQNGDNQNGVSESTPPLGYYQKPEHNIVAVTDMSVPIAPFL